MAVDTSRLPIGQKIRLPGHFDQAVILEGARGLGKGFEFRVRLPDGSLDETVVSEDEAQALIGEEVRDTGAPVGPASAPERRPGDIEPDPLRQPPESFAPDLRDGLFLVPKLSVLHDDAAGGSGR